MCQATNTTATMDGLLSSVFGCVLDILHLRLRDLKIVRKGCNEKWMSREVRFCVM